MASDTYTLLMVYPPSDTELPQRRKALARALWGSGALDIERAGNRPLLCISTPLFLYALRETVDDLGGACSLTGSTYRKLWQLSTAGSPPFVYARLSLLVIEPLGVWGFPPGVCLSVTIGGATSGPGDRFLPVVRHR